MELKNLIASSEAVEVFKEGDKVIKLFREGCPKTMALYESLTHSRVEATGLKVPVIHEVSVIDGRWAIIMDCIEGKTFADLISENPDKADEYIETMVNLQTEIHSKITPKLGHLNEKLQRLIDSLDIDSIKKYELFTRLDSMPKHNKLCHCNFSPENIIMNDDGIYILDWVAARQGNASADAANTYLRLSLDYSKDIADKYLNLFCEKTGTTKKYVQEWLPIVAAARLTAKNPEEEALLNEWVDVVAYE